jgi:acetoin utilization protein AcuB
MSAAQAPRSPGATPLAVWIVGEPVRTWMRQAVVTVGTKTPLHEVAALMRERHIRHLPVVDESRRLVGIVTDRDLRQVVFDAAIRDRLGPDAAKLGELPVQEVMTWGVISVGPATDLREAATIMRERRLGSLPVVEDGRVVGILTETDMLSALQALLGARVAGPAPAAGGQPGDYDFGFPLPPPGEPWRNDSATS